jgi:hypothetical protein
MGSSASASDRILAVTCSVQMGHIQIPVSVTDGRWNACLVACTT